MVVLIVDKDSILAFKLEGQPPVSADADGPVIFQFPSQPVEVPSRSIQVAGVLGAVEGQQLQSQLAGVLGLNPRFRSGAEEFLHAAMPEALNHFV